MKFDPFFKMYGMLFKVVYDISGEIIPGMRGSISKLAILTWESMGMGVGSVIP